MKLETLRVFTGVDYERNKAYNAKPGQEVGGDIFL